MRCVQKLHVCCSVLQCVAVCCSVLQCVAKCCSVLQCVAMRCSVLQFVAVCCSLLQCVAVCYSVLQCVLVCCSVLWNVAECFRVLQSVAVCCGVLRCVAVCCGVESSHTHCQWPKRTTHTHFDVSKNVAWSRTHSQRRRHNTHLGRVATHTQIRSPIHPHTLAESSRTHCQWRRRSAPHCCPSPPFAMHTKVWPAKWAHSDALLRS